MRRPERSVECSDSEKKMSACADQNHAPSLTCVRLELSEYRFQGISYSKQYEQYRHNAIDPDEVIDSMRRIGNQLPACLKETSEGGLATTESARHYQS